MLSVTTRHSDVSGRPVIIRHSYRVLNVSSRVIVTASAAIIVVDLGRRKSIRTLIHDKLTIFSERTSDYTYINRRWSNFIENRPIGNLLDVFYVALLWT